MPPVQPYPWRDWASIDYLPPVPQSNHLCLVYFFSFAEADNGTYHILILFVWFGISIT